jgi:hypothetical protein
MGIVRSLLRGTLRTTAHAAAAPESALALAAAWLADAKARRALRAQTARRHMTCDVTNLPPIVARTPATAGDERVRVVLGKWNAVCAALHAEHGAYPPWPQHEFFARLLACALPALYQTAADDPRVRARFGQWMRGAVVTLVAARRFGKSMVAAAAMACLACAMNWKFYFGHIDAEYNKPLAEYLAIFARVCGIEFEGHESQRRMRLGGSDVICFGHGPNAGAKVRLVSIIPAAPRLAASNRMPKHLFRAIPRHFIAISCRFIALGVPLSPKRHETRVEVLERLFDARH